MKGVIAAGHEVTAAAGAEILRAGGNAFDATLAAMFASTIPEVVLSSVGGGGFLMAHRPDAKSRRGVNTLYDFFVDTPRFKRAPRDLDFYGIHADFGPATQEFHIGAGAAATPGIVAGAFAIHRDLCSMPMSDLLKPAIKAAREGITVSPFHAYLFTIIEPILRASPEAKALFAPHGALLKAGDIYRNPALGETYEALGREGPALFTSGVVGDEILKQANERGGQLTRDDLENYAVHKRTPLNWQHGGMQLALNPAPAQSGALIAFGLGLIQELSTRKGSELSLTDLISVMKLTNDIRSTHGCDLAAELDLVLVRKHLDEALAHTAQTRGTTHISVIDDIGNAAAVTVSNGEGCGHMVGRHGFMLNNMLGEEDLNTDGFHNWEPGVRMSTMMAPTIATGGDGRLLALGSGGSNRIRTAILQVLHYVLDRGLGLDDAVRHPRIHLERGGVLSFENVFDAAHVGQIMDGIDRAHPWPERNMFFGGVHSAERRVDGTFLGVGDPRRNGAAIVVE